MYGLTIAAVLFVKYFECAGKEFPDAHSIASSPGGDSMSLAMARCLQKEFKKLHSQSDLRVVILRSMGERFCNGGDPSSWVHDAWTELNKSEGSNSENQDLGVAAAAVHEVVSLSTVLSNLSVPVLAVLHGNVHGVGLAMALAADWRVCTSDVTLKCDSDALFGLNEAMRRVIGPRDETYMADLPSSAIRSVEALEVGLVSSTHGTVDEAASAAMLLADEVAGASKQATRNAMQLIRPQDQTRSVMKASVDFVVSLKPFSSDGSRTDLGKEMRSLVVLGPGTVNVQLPAGLPLDKTVGILEFAATEVAATSGTSEDLALIIHLPARFGGPGMVTSAHAWYLRDWFRCCKLPTIVVCADLVQADGLVLPLLADVCAAGKNCVFDLAGASNLVYGIAAERHGPRACSAFFRSKRLTVVESQGLGLVQAVIEPEEIQLKIDALVRQASSVCERKRPMWAMKTRLPELEPALLDLVSRGSAPTNITSAIVARTEGLVTLDISEGEIATVTLNDPTKLNSLSAALIADLRIQLNEVHRLVGIGQVQVMILRANGPNFCVGGGGAAGGQTQWPAIVNQVILIQKSVVMCIRSPNRATFPPECVHNTGGRSE